MTDQLVLDSATLGRLEKALVFHSVTSDLNPDGEVHIVSGAAQDGQELLVSFEDLIAAGSDHDYQDAILGITADHRDLFVA